MGKRLMYFVGTNLAVMVLFGVVMSLLSSTLGIDSNGIVALLIMSFLFGMAGSLISLAMSKTIAKRMVGAQVITEPRNDAERWVLETTYRLADEAGIGRPEVAVYDSPDLNAFATGAKRNDALVAVSTGLLRSMRTNEVEAVLAHEISHVANGDMVTLTLIQGVLNTLVIFASRILGGIVDRVVFNRDSNGPGYYIFSILFQVVLGLFATLIVRWFSRRREFRADAGGGALTSNADMAAALDRLRSGAEADLPDQVAAMGIRGGKADGFRRLLMTHPPIEERIAALRS